jgi:hypothetical protein
MSYEIRENIWHPICKEISCSGLGDFCKYTPERCAIVSKIMDDNKREREKYKQANGEYPNA